MRNALRHIITAQSRMECGYPEEGSRKGQTERGIFGDTVRETASDRAFHCLWICVGKWMSRRPRPCQATQQAQKSLVRFRVDTL